MAVPNTLANPNLTGGMRNETEYGFELKFFDNRFGIDFTYLIEKIQIFLYLLLLLHLQDTQDYLLTLKSHHLMVLN